MDSQLARLGLFVSYSEKKNGPFQDAVDVCNSQEYVVWLARNAVKTQRFSFPATILVKIKGEDRYYQGELRDMKRANEVDRSALLAEATHRPARWQQVDNVDYADFKSVFYIAGLKRVARPPALSKKGPQHPWYVEEAILKGQHDPIVPLAEELPSTDKLTEGAGCQVTINAYERNPIARSRCIAHYGPACVVCGFSFGGVYGPLAEGYIHVHHLKPLSEIGEDYQVDQVADLRPVCPNCHAVIHLDGACRSIEAVSQLLAPEKAR
jgi:hypothetical protein